MYGLNTHHRADALLSVKGSNDVETQTVPLESFQSSFQQFAKSGCLTALSVPKTSWKIQMAACLS